jgi:ubiquinone/menaquinone biosynthesis C-methylase UbiE
MGNIEKFNQMANRYDTPDREEIAGIIAGAVRPYIVNGKDKRAIDFGCGTGLVGLRLLNEFKSMLFIDAAENMVEMVKLKIQASGVRNAETLCCDMTECHKELSADYILMSQTLLHIKEIERVLSVLYRILNKGGHLLIVDFDKNERVVSDEVHNGFVQNQLIETVKKVGFASATSKTFYHGSRMFMNQDASLFILEALT